MWSLFSVERNRSSTGSGFSPYESFRKSSVDRPKSGTPDKRDSWNVEDIGTALDTFRPVTITISSFFKQVPAVFYAVTLHCTVERKQLALEKNRKLPFFYSYVQNT